MKNLEKQAVGSNKTWKKVFYVIAVVALVWGAVRLLFLPGIISGKTGIVVSIALGILFWYLGMKCRQDENFQLPAEAPIVQEDNHEEEVAPAATPPEPSVPAKLSRKYLRVREDEIADLLVEAEEILSNAEAEEDAFRKLEAEYDEKLKKARQRRQKPAQP